MGAIDEKCGLAHCQNESGLHAEASETIKRVPANEKTSWDYSSMASYLRAAHQYQAALDAGDESVKLEADSAQVHFERACALAQLGRTQEALAAIEKAIELEEDEEFDLEDSDLKPLATMPEFKALAEKRGKRSTGAMTRCISEPIPH